MNLKVPYPGQVDPGTCPGNAECEAGIPPGKGNKIPQTFFTFYSKLIPNILLFAIFISNKKIRLKPGPPVWC